ncbi:hypothetical protein M679_06105, partial [Neisseria gonorrhoeae SK7842]
SPNFTDTFSNSGFAPNCMVMPLVEIIMGKTFIEQEIKFFEFSDCNITAPPSETDGQIFRHL